MSELLIEIENKAQAKSDEEYFHHSVAYQLLIGLEMIEENIAANLRIATDATYGFSSKIA